MTPAPPPTGSLHKFPARRWGAQMSFYRASGKDFDGRWHSPWYFCTDGDCRFDLPQGSMRGTLYAGTDKVTGLLEYIGRHGPPLVTPTFLSTRRICELNYDVGFALASLADERATDFGADIGLSTDPEYPQTQKWAAAFDAADFDGISYSARHVPHDRPTAVAMFDLAGSHDWVISSITPTTDSAVLSLLADHGVTVSDGPMLAELNVIN